MAISDNIRTFRKRLGYSQAELASHIGVKAQTVQKYESGEITNIPYENLVKLAKALDVTEIELLGLQTEVSAETACLMNQVRRDEQLRRMVAYISKMSEIQKDSLEVIIKGMV